MCDFQPVQVCCDKPSLAVTSLAQQTANTVQARGCIGLCKQLGLIKAWFPLNATNATRATQKNNRRNVLVVASLASAASVALDNLYSPQMVAEQERKITTKS